MPKFSSRFGYFDEFELQEECKCRFFTTFGYFDDFETE